jgi:hypothetical protein
VGKKLFTAGLVVGGPPPTVTVIEATLLGPERLHGLGQGACIEYVTYDWLSPKLAQHLGLLGRTGHSRYLASIGDEQPNQPHTDHTARACEKDPHGTYP